MLPYEFETWSRYITLAYRAHMHHSRSESGKFRRHDGATPYAVHVVWSSTTFLHEEAVDLKTRWLGAKVLLLHDVKEDTTLEFPNWVSLDERDLVDGMSFSSFADEIANLWSREWLVIFLKCYDKASNLIDSGWMDQREEGYRVRYEQHALNVASWVETNVPEGHKLAGPKIIRALIRTPGLEPQTPWIK